MACVSHSEEWTICLARVCMALCACVRAHRFEPLAGTHGLDVLQLVVANSREDIIQIADGCTAHNSHSQLISGGRHQVCELSCWVTSHT